MVSFRLTALLTGATFTLCALAASDPQSRSVTALAARVVPRQADEGPEGNEDIGQGDITSTSSDGSTVGGSPNSQGPGSNEDTGEGVPLSPNSPDPDPRNASPQTPERNRLTHPNSPPGAPVAKRPRPAVGAAGSGSSRLLNHPINDWHTGAVDDPHKKTSSPDSLSHKSSSSNSSSPGRSSPKGSSPKSPRPKRPRPDSPPGGDKAGPSTKPSNHPRPRSLVGAFGGTIPGPITAQGKALTLSPDSLAPPPGSSSEPRVRFSKDK